MAAEAMALLQGQLDAWEAEYAAEHGCAPTKDTVPPMVKAKYRELAMMRRAQEQQQERTSALSATHSERVVDLRSRARSTAKKTLAEVPKLHGDVAARQARSLPARPLVHVDRNVPPRPLPAPGAKLPVPAPAAPAAPAASAASVAKLPAVLPPPSLPIAPWSSSSTTTTTATTATQEVPTTTAMESTTAATEKRRASTVFSLESDASSADETEAPKRAPAARPAPKRALSSKAKPNFQRTNLKRQWQPKRKQNNPSAKRRRQLEWIERRNERSAAASATAPRPDFRPPDDAVLVAMDPAAAASASASASGVTMCMHGLPAVERTVKKASTGNKGRTFYACGQPRETQCAFFLWADDAKPAAASAVQRVQAPGNGPAFASMSLAELKAAARKLGASASGTKAALSSRLRALWAEREAGFAALDRSDKRAVLDAVFGHDEFLPGQEAAVDGVLAGESLLIVQSTGSGKSLMYQLPACMLDGLVLVVCPLVALMQDQLASLPPGLAGACLHSSQSLAEQTATVRLLREGAVRVLFVAPERLLTASFQRLLRQLAVRLVCVDEAHCVSTWSHNFRPAYLRLGGLLRTLLPPSTPVLALTASATMRVRAEVCAKLGLRVPPSSPKAAASWLRGNLRLRVEIAGASTERKVARLLELIKPGESCIVYASMKSETEVLAERLCSAGLSAAPYHAGLTRALRHRTQAEFMCGKVAVVVATVAFGMGLDKSDVRRVVHWQVPRSIEDYVQEVGRAGRDGEDAECVVLFDAADCQRLLSLARGDGVEEPQVRRLLELLPADRLVGLSLAATSRELDMREAVIETLLVGLAERGTIELLPNGFCTCDVALGTRSDVLVEAVRECGTLQPNASYRVALGDIAARLGLETPSECVFSPAAARGG